MWEGSIMNPIVIQLINNKSTEIIIIIKKKLNIFRALLQRNVEGIL